MTVNVDLKDWLNSINCSKRNLIDEDPDVEKKYPAYIINRCMSGHLDAIMYANEMNFHNHIDSKLQFDFFLNSIRPKKRYGKWLKRKKEDNQVLDLIKEYCKCSYAKARDYALLLNDSQLDIIRQHIDTGGLKGNNE